MKKIIVLALLAVLLLAACSSANPSQGENSNMKTYEYISDYNEYIKYIERETRLPDNFVVWEDISLLGQWEVFYMPIDQYAGNGRITKYTYGMTDGNINDLTLDINHEPEKSSIFDVFDSSKPEKVTKPAKLESMKKIPVEQNENGYVINHNGLNYNYNKWGEIVTISWNENGILFTLSGTLLRYPENPKPAFVTKLLSAADEDVNQAFAEIKQFLDTE